MRAVIRVSENADTLVAGLPILARSVLALWSAGMRRFTLIAASADGPSAHDLSLREITRVAPGARLSWIAPSEPDPHALVGERVVLLPTLAVFRTDSLTKAIADHPQSDMHLAPAQDSDAGFQVLSADSYNALANGGAVKLERMVLPEGHYYPGRSRTEIFAAERAVFRWCIKETDGMVSRYLNRPISTWISRHLSHTAIRPTQLTAFTGLLALLMFFALVGGSVTLITLGCVLYHVTSVIDGLDGEIARAKYMSSPRGAMLDTAVDMATNLLFILGISLGNRQIYDPIYGWIGAYIAFIAIVAMLTMTLCLHFGPGGGSFDVLHLTIKRRLQNTPRLSRAFGFINAFFKRDLFAFLFAIMGLFGDARGISWLLAFGVTAWLLTILINVPALLSSRREDVLPPHILRASATNATDYAESHR
jgi:CDP-L-myo-inositol myo-inositolphosphotransferase